MGLSPGCGCIMTWASSRVFIFLFALRHSVVAFCCERLAAKTRVAVPLYSGLSRFVVLASKLRLLVYDTGQKNDGRFLFP